MANSNKNTDVEETMPELLPAPMAYLNPEFLNSPDGRLLRILSEYQEPLSRFRREKIQDTVVFFGSARFASLPDAQNALFFLMIRRPPRSTLFPYRRSSEHRAG